MKKRAGYLILSVFIFLSSKCYAQPTCSFSLLDTSVCSPVVLIATANSDPNVATRVWSLTTCTGASVYTTQGTGQNPNFSYVINTPGCYCLNMTSTDQNGGTCTFEKCNITVAANPIPDFTFTPVEGCIPLTVTAQCNSNAGSGTIDSVVIDWGCVGLSFYNSCQTASITYVRPACSPGLQSPSIIIKNSFGCYAEESFPNLINLIPDPIANFTADVTTANCTTNPLTVNFTADSADPHITYTWYINGSEVQSSASRLLNHTFPVDSNCYTIKLVVSHPSGCSDSLTKTDYICVRSQPLVTFTQNITSACVNAESSDSLILQNTSDGVSSLTWQLTSNPAQTFPTVNGPRAAFAIAIAGTYTLTASAVFSTGCTGTVTRQVLVVGTKPTAGFTQSDTVGCKLPFPVTYTADACTGCSYAWSLSQATPPTLTSAVAAVNYTTYGTHGVTLIVTAADGCSDTLAKRAAIGLESLAPKIYTDRLKGCSPVCADFHNATSTYGWPMTIASTCWSFPGSNITGGCTDTFSACFTQPGCYNIKMVTTTSTGCKDSITIPNDICVANPPVNSLTVSSASICYHDTVTFNVTGDTISYCVVNFGDSTGKHVFTGATFRYVFQDTGHFCVNVITYRDSCRGDSLITCITVNPPIANFADSTTCKTTDTVFLNNKSIGALSYKWYFCTGDSSTLANPFKILPYCDTCTVTLVAYNSVTGCQNKKTLTLNTACDVSAFTPVDTQGCAPLKVRFTNTSISNTPAFTAWDWDCNNGTTWTGAGTSGGTSVSHTFTTPGTFCIAMRNESAGGCVDTVYGSVTVCQVAAYFKTDSSCFPAPFCFIDSSTGSSCGALTWSWNFGDTATSNIENPCHVYPAPGTYPVKLVITTALGCRDSIIKSVIISSPVHVDFEIDTFVCPGVQTCVNNNSTGVALVYNWTMPGASPGTTYTTASPCYTYQNPGDYTAYFQLSSNNQCAVNDTFQIHVHAPIAGGYASSDYIACPNPPQLIVFTDTSEFADTLWHWDFGDSTFSNQQNASHIYVVPGTYLVTETVTDKGGCSNTAFIDTITVAGPYGNVSYTPSVGVCACKDSVTFVVSTYDAVNVVFLYGCNSGLAQISPQPIGTRANPTFDTLTVGYCLTDTCRTTVVVDDATGCQVFLPTQLVTVDSPVVKMTFNNHGVCYAGTICFYDSTTYYFSPPVSYTVSRLWDFGDGTTDTAIAPCHYYSQPGNYNVRLYVHSNVGCFDSIISEHVIIPNYPVAGYYADTSFACANSPICFHDTSVTDSSTAPAFWEWSFGDGSPVETVFNRTVCHIYTTAGLYRVKDCVFDSIGCSTCDSSTTINVIPNPVANAGGDQVICYGVVTQLNGTSGGGTNYVWSPPGLFSNPDISNPTIQLFTDTVVTFTVSNNHNCTNTDTIAIQLASVTANFSVGHDFCLGNNICVTNSSTGVLDSIISYWYNFGNTPPHTVNGANNCYVYTDTGNFNITQVVIDNHGCTDTIIKPVIIFSVPVADFSISDTVICSNQQICFTDLSTSAAGITSWLWNYGDNSGSSLSTPPCHLYSAPYKHTYPISLQVTDQNNCSDTIQLIETVNQVPEANFNWTSTCADEKMPLSNTSLPGDGGIISCQWVLWLGATNPVIDSNCFTSFQFPPGTHNVQLVVTDVNGCTDTIVQPVVTDSLTQLTLTPRDTTICLGSSINYQVTGVFNNIDWTNDIWISDAHASLVTITPLSNVTYFVRVQNGVCGAVSDSFNIQVIQPIPIEVNATPQQIVLGLTSNITSQIPGQIDSIVWTPDSTLDCYTCPNPVAKPLQTTTYMATIYYSQNGISCSNSAQVTIDVLNSCEGGIIYVPNTFTPNGDGKNDVFLIRGLAATKIDYFRVFDRWGRTVFESADGVPNDPQFGWDGNDKDGKKLNPDVYVYTYEIQCINGNIVAGQGNVTLVR